MCLLITNVLCPYCLLLSCFVIYMDTYIGIVLEYAFILGNNIDNSILKFTVIKFLPIISVIICVIQGENTSYFTFNTHWCRRPAVLSAMISAMSIHCSTHRLVCFATHKVMPLEFHFMPFTYCLTTCLDL